jgi:flagellum-specific peptidoglycan hydrolase FlgJ
MTPKEFIQLATTCAQTAGHIFPQMAACEAALESGYGRSQLAAADNNLFGMKQHRHPEYGTVNLPTKEFVKDTAPTLPAKDAGKGGATPAAGKWVETMAEFVKYPDWESCFRDRMETLRRLAPHYPHYAAALAANTPEQYVTEVSRSWSTDPGRAGKVLSLFREYCASPRITLVSGNK